MSMPNTYDPHKLEKELPLTDGEKALWNNASSTTDHAIILLSKSLERNSASNDRYSRAMNWLTAGILFATIVGVIIQLGK